MPIMLPTARRADLVIHEVHDEVLIYDPARAQASVLNRTAAVIWSLADGTATLTDIARSASRALNAPVDTALVMYTLEQLSKKNLMQTPVASPAPQSGMTRRDFLRAGAVGAAVVLPVVVTVAAPSVSFAASCVADGQPCTTPSECCSNTCSSDICQ